MTYQIESGIPIPEKTFLQINEFYNLIAGKKYAIHYKTLVERASRRVLTEYSENHHIIPKCIGGSNHVDNYARLTASEHYVAHQLLVKLFPNEPKLVYAAHMMSLNANGLRVGNKLYSWLRKRLAIETGNRFRGISLPEEHRNKISLANMGKIVSAESIMKSSIGRTGGKRSDEAKANIGATSKRPDRVAALIARNKSYIGREVTRETRDKLSVANKGKKMPPKTPECLALMSLKMKGRKLPPRTLEWSRNIGLGHKGKIIPQELRDRISASLMGHETTEECKAKLSLLNKGKKIKEPRSEQWRERMSAAKTGGKATAETKEKMAESHRLRWAVKKVLKEILAAWSCAL